MRKHQKYFIKLLNYSKKIKEGQGEIDIKTISSRYFQTEFKETNNLFKNTLIKIDNEIKVIKTDVELNLVSEEEGQKLKEICYIMKEVIKKRKEVNELV